MATTEDPKTNSETMKAVVEPEKPLDYPTVLTTVVVRNADEALAWYEKALNATVQFRYEDAVGKVFHAVLSTEYGLMLGVEDHAPKMHMVAPAGEKGEADAETEGAANVTAGASYCYVTVPSGKGSADECVERMREFGGVVVQEPTDMFYGHRLGKVIDKFGVAWAFSHKIEAPKKAGVGEDGQTEAAEPGEEKVGEEAKE